jgi:hypothetical protein
MGLRECPRWIDVWNCSFATAIDASTGSRRRIFVNGVARHGECSLGHYKGREEVGLSYDIV